MDVCMYVCMYVHRIRLSCKRKLKCIYTRGRIHTRIHIYIYICMYIHTRARVVMMDYSFVYDHLDVSCDPVASLFRPCCDFCQVLLYQMYAHWHMQSCLHMLYSR